MGYQGINSNVWTSFFGARPFFVPREHRWGDHIYKGKNMGYQFAAWGRTFSGYLNCNKQYPEMSNYLPHFAEA